MKPRRNKQGGKGGGRGPLRGHGGPGRRSENAWRRAPRGQRGDGPRSLLSPRGSGEKIYMYGKHALQEALSYAPQAVRRVFLSPEVTDQDLHNLLRKNNIVPGVLRSNEMANMVGRDTAHQGVIAIMNPGAIMTPFSDFLESFRRGNGGVRRGPEEHTLLVLLDELTDPHNVGAIIRSAAAFGAAGVLIPSHNQAPITGTVVKTSAGMVFRVPLIAIGNVNQTVDALKKEGFRTYGLAMDGATNVVDEPFDAPALVVVGNEGVGIREHTIARCDVRLRIPMDKRTESLNASVSAAVVLYQWSVKHPPAGQAPGSK